MDGETPVQWCARMESGAKDGNEAYNYFQLKEVWLNRENKDGGEEIER